MSPATDNLLITLELDPGEPITGRLTRGGAEPESFEGMLELIAALDRARAVAAEPVVQADT